MPKLKVSSQKKRILEQFVSKKAFDVAGLGPKIIDQLQAAGLISQSADLFKLKKEDLLSLERFAEKKAKNIIEAIEKSKKISLAKFIFSLGIRHVGEETAIALSKMKFHRLGSIDNLKKASQEELEKIPDLGPKISESIYNWFRLPPNQKLVADLIKAGVKIGNPKPQIPNPRLNGLTFVLTGSLKTMSREKAKEKIRLLGGKVSDLVSRKTSFVLAGKDPGSKYDKARKLGIQIINEKEFLELIHLELIH